MSLRRHKQFAMIQPSAAGRIDLGLILRDVPPGARLESAKGFNALFTHRVRLTSTANGAADPTDPAANVAAAPRTMRGALLVTIPGGLHQVAPSNCLAHQATAFIQAGKPADRAAWAACARTLGHKYPAFPPAP